LGSLESLFYATERAEIVLTSIRMPRNEKTRPQRLPAAGHHLAQSVEKHINDDNSFTEFCKWLFVAKRVLLVALIYLKKNKA
jgi:hypothetical protein